MNAQDQNVAPRLEELIPDSAVQNPVEWARQDFPETVEVPEEAMPDVRADSPLAEMPLVTVPWPEDIELPQLAPLEVEEDIQFADLGIEGPAAVGLENAFTVDVSDELTLAFPSDDTLFPVREEFVSRFRSLSTIEELDDENVAARLMAQAEEDQDLLERLLRIYGYYGGRVIRSTPPRAAEGQVAESTPEVRFDIIPGTQYAFDRINLGSLNEAGDDYGLLRKVFEIESGDPILADKIEEERYDLGEALGETGYPFAEIEEPELLIDHATEMGDLTMPVTPGGKYAFGRVISDMPDFLSSKHVASIARFDPGDIYQRSLEDDLREALLATGIVSSVTLTPVVVEEPSPGDPGTVDLAVNIVPAPLRTIAGSLGYGTGEGFKAEVSWENRNLFPPEGMLRVRAIAGTQEQLLGVLFRKSNFGGRDRALNLDAYASTIDSEAYDSQTVSFLGSYGRVNTLFYQKGLTWSFGLELVATKERPPKVADQPREPYQTYLIAAIPLQAQIDTSNDLLNPTEGFRLGGRLSPEISHTQGSESFYLRSQVDAAYYRQINEKVILAGRIRLGSIPGAPLSAIAPSRRYYAGGGGSVRGYGYQAIGPRNERGEPSGGRSVTELSVEARIRTGLLGGAVSVVPFVDAGAVSTSSTPTFDEIKIGAGVGLRYLTGFGPIRLDVGVPINPGPDDSALGVYIGLGQAF